MKTQPKIRIQHFISIRSQAKTELLKKNVVKLKKNQNYKSQSIRYRYRTIWGKKMLSNVVTKWNFCYKKYIFSSFSFFYRYPRFKIRIWIHKVIESGSGSTNLVFYLDNDDESNVHSSSVLSFQASFVHNILKLYTRLEETDPEVDKLVRPNNRLFLNIQYWRGTDKLHNFCHMRVPGTYLVCQVPFFGHDKNVFLVSVEYSRKRFCTYCTNTTSKSSFKCR
jgi:hypothetical protein